MKKVSFEGFGAQYLTFKKASGASIQKGGFVALNTASEVIAASAGEIFGVCADINGDLVTVQVSGYIKATMATSESITPGVKHIGIDSSGKIKTLSTAKSILVTDANSITKEIGFIL